MAYEDIRDSTTGWLRSQAAKLKQIPGVGDMADRVSGYAEGAKTALRGAEATPGTIGDTVASAARDSGLTEAQVQRPDVRATLPGINQTVAQVQGETAALGPQVAANPNSLRTPNTGANPNIQPGGVSPEAAAYDTAKQVKTGGEAAVKGVEGAKPGILSKVGDAMKQQLGLVKDTAGNTPLRNAAVSAGTKGLGALTWAAKKVGPAEQLYNASDAASRAISAPDGQGLNEAKRGGINMLATSIGRFGGGVLGAGAGALTGPAAPALIPAGAVGGQAVGADLGRRAGEFITDKLYGPKQGIGIGDRITQAMAADGPANLRTSNVQPAQTQAQSGSIADTSGYQQAQQVPTSAGPQAPEQILARNSNSGVPAAGTGAIRTGNGPAVAVGSPGAMSLSGADNAYRAPRNNIGGLRKLAATGPMGAVGALGAYGALTKMKEKSAEVGLRGQALANTQRQQNYTALKDQRDYATAQLKDKRDFDAKQQQQDRELNTKALGSEIDSRAREAVGAQGYTEGDPAYKNRVENAKSQYEKRIRYGVANRADGKRLEDMNATERTQLHDAAKFQDKVVGARGTLRQNIKDFFGNPQTDSNDPYSFMPARTDAGGKPVAATRDADGAIRVRTVNGNTIAVKEAGDGKINFFSSNNPVDSDMLKLMQPQIDALKKQDQKKGK